MCGWNIDKFLGARGPSQVPQPTLRCGLGLQYPYRRGIFLCSPVALPILAEHGQMDAYWVPEHLRKLQPQSHFCSLTGLGSSTPFLSSASLQLLPETDISLLLSWICHFQLSVFPPPVCNFCWRKVRLYSSANAFQISFVPFYLPSQLGIFRWDNLRLVKKNCPFSVINKMSR